MSHVLPSKIKEINRNYERFLTLLPQLLDAHQGDFVLMRHGEVIGHFEEAIEAQIAGREKFDDGLFSIQPVKQAAEELGYYSHALDPR